MELGIGRLRKSVYVQKKGIHELQSDKISEGEIKVEKSRRNSWAPNAGPRREIDKLFYGIRKKNNEA